MKTREELQELIDHFSSETNPVGMDVIYVHAVILDKLTQIENRLAKLESGENKK